ncbi:MAG TPA: O-antigen ligase family protein [Gaiellaceae bacterium]|nr:O-antigen ligase family protein [Gaiellaceae bacterium]
MRAAGERVGELAAAVLAFCALFFAGGHATAPLVWIGGLALVLAALLVVAPTRLDAPAVLFLGALFGLAVWSGLTTLWSMSPDTSWQFTNRSLVYAAFGLVGVLVGSRVSRGRLAGTAAFLLALLAGWALLAKCVPALYSDYGRIARLRAPVEYWNELALLCDAGVPLALWLAARRRIEGVVLLYLLVLTLLLTYSRFGVALACAAAAVWIVFSRERVEGLAAIALGGGIGAAVFGVALALPGITSDGQSRVTRAHDGWIFALVVLAGAAVAATAARLLRDREITRERRVRVERVAGVAALLLAVAGLAVSIAYAGRIWSEFTNPANTQVVNTQTRFGSAKSNRWTWWEEAWHAFTRHPGGGTGAGTFELTNQMLRHSPVVVDEPHNTPLQFLSETGIVGLLLYLGVAAGALWGAWRARRDPAGLALGIAVAVFFVHGIVDKDWNYVATCGPLFLVAGALVASPAPERARPRLLLAAGALAFALAATYSLAAPWLSDRALASATTAAEVEHAHSYDPLSVDTLIEWATFEDATGNIDRANELYLQAVDLEPQNARTWYALGAFYYGHKLWRLAYDALNNSYTYDRFGLAAQPCGLLDRARWNAGFRFGPNCRAGARSSSP